MVVYENAWNFQDCFHERGEPDWLNSDYFCVLCVALVSTRPWLSQTTHSVYCSACQTKPTYYPDCLHDDRVVCSSAFVIRLASHAPRRTTDVVSCSNVGLRTLPSGGTLGGRGHKSNLLSSIVPEPTNHAVRCLYWRLPGRGAVARQGIVKGPVPVSKRPCPKWRARPAPFTLI